MTVGPGRVFNVREDSRKRQKDSANSPHKLRKKAEGCDGQRQAHTRITRQSEKTILFGNGEQTHDANNGEGNNSDDEYSIGRNLSSNAQEAHKEFKKSLESMGLKIIVMKEDGSCLFRAVAQQIYGDQETHAVVRESCMSFIDRNWNFYSDFVTEEKESYLLRKRNASCHGNHVEIAAMSRLYDSRIEIYVDSFVPINTFNSPVNSDSIKPAIRLYYRNNNHYDAIVDCSNPLSPVEKDSLANSGQQKVANSFGKLDADFESIERTHINKTLSRSDWEDTENEILLKIREDSIVEWHQHNMKRRNHDQGSSEYEWNDSITKGLDSEKT